MSNIVIKDLAESMELDNEAMRTILGGSRSSARKTNVSNSLKRSDSLLMANVIGSEKFRTMTLTQFD